MVCDRDMSRADLIRPAPPTGPSGPGIERDQIALARVAEDVDHSAGDRRRAAKLASVAEPSSPSRSLALEIDSHEVSPIFAIPVTQKAVVDSEVVARVVHRHELFLGDQKVGRTGRIVVAGASGLRETREHHTVERVFDG